MRGKHAVGLLAVVFATACTHGPSAPPPPLPNTQQRSEQSPTDVQPYVDGAPARRPAGQPEAKSSGGSLRLPKIRASREHCVSPCTVMFSIDPIKDSTDENAFVHSGVYWDYGDALADETQGLIERGAQFERTGKGVSREHDTNTPLGMHTYICETGICSFHAGVAVSNAAGDWVTAWTTIDVRSQATTYPGPRTVCISTQGKWGGDNPCPQGAKRQRDLPTLQEWRSDTRYLLRRGERFNASRSCIGYGMRGITITSFGDDSKVKPELSAMAVGRSRNCSRAIVSDRELTRIRPAHWIENITLADLRVESVGLGMTFKDITLYDLDMDFERQPNGGVIFNSAANRCNRDPQLSCPRVPLPYGLYISNSHIVGSRTKPPGLNVALMNTACASFVGIYDTKIRVASEHNVRVECSSRLLAIHSTISGEHIGGRGPKSAITIRPDGTKSGDMLLGRRADADDEGDVFESRYTVLKDLYLPTPAKGQNAARLTIAPTAANKREVTRLGLISQCVTNLEKGGAPSTDARLTGAGLVCYDDNRWQAKGCIDAGPGSMPRGSYVEAQTSFPAPEVPKPPAAY